MDAAKELFRKTTGVPGDAGPMVIDGLVDTDRARIERDLDRRRFLNRKALNVFLENGSPLTAARITCCDCWIA
jgi:hypothetical protein